MGVFYDPEGGLGSILNNAWFQKEVVVCRIDSTNDNSKCRPWDQSYFYGTRKSMNFIWYHSTVFYCSVTEPTIQIPYLVTQIILIYTETLRVVYRVIYNSVHIWL